MYEHDSMNDLAPEITRPEPKNMIKQYLYEKLINKPLGELNWWYSFIDNFYNADLNASMYEGKFPYERVPFKNLNVPSPVLKRHLHSDGGASSALTPAIFDEDNCKYAWGDKFQTTEHKNYQISTLECLWEQFDDSHRNKLSSAVCQLSQEKLYRVYFTLKNIVRTSYKSKSSSEVEAITMEVIEEMVKLYLMFR